MVSPSLISSKPDRDRAADLEALARVLPARGRRASALRLLDGRSLCSLARLEATALADVGGLSPSSARRLAAVLRLGQRISAENSAPGAPGGGGEGGGRGQEPLAGRPSTAARWLIDAVAGCEVETFQVLLLDPRHRIRDRLEVSRGTLNASLVHPREVFREAIRRGAAAIIVGHNHPSGDPEPSAEDYAVTRRLCEVGTLVGIPLLDHLVLGGPGWVSLRQRMGARWPTERGCVPGASLEAPPGGGLNPK